jgi:hypothetical protein
MLTGYKADVKRRLRERGYSLALRLGERRFPLLGVFSAHMLRGIDISSREEAVGGRDRWGYEFPVLFIRRRNHQRVGPKLYLETGPRVVDGILGIDIAIEAKGRLDLHIALKIRREGQEEANGSCFGHLTLIDDMGFVVAAEDEIAELMRDSSPSHLMPLFRGWIGSMN